MIVPSYEPAAEATDEELRANIAPAVYAAVRDSLEADGTDPMDASRMATRAAKLAVVRLLGVGQDAAADILEVSPRTARYDLERWHRVMYNGTAHRAAAGPLPPVPVDGEGS